MNKVVLMGNMTRDIEVNVSGNGFSTGKFGIAVRRRFKNKETGQYDADFINCTAFGQSAEFISKYFHKGDPILVSGRIQTGSYTNKDGQKVYTTDVIIEEADFCGGKSASAKPNAEFMDIPEGSPEHLPF